MKCIRKKKYITRFKDLSYYRYLKNIFQLDIGN